MRSTAEWEAALEGTTRGPWTWDDHRVPSLTGRGGSPETFEYESDVLEADHNGECGCRSACNLELNVNDEDKSLIALAPEAVAEVVRLRRELELRVRIWQKVAEKLKNRGDEDGASQARHTVAVVTRILEDTHE